MGLSAAFRFADGPAGAIVTLIFCHESREKCRIPQANDDVQRDREEYGKAEGHDDTRCAEWDAEIITRDHVHPIPIQRPAMIAAVWSLELLETHLALTNKFSILKKGSTPCTNTIKHDSTPGNAAQTRCQRSSSGHSAARDPIAIAWISSPCMSYF